MATVLTATTDGSIVGYFDIPTGVPAGSKRVVFEGVVSHGEADFTGRGTLTTREVQRALTATQSYPTFDRVPTYYFGPVTWVGPGDWNAGADPIAQTFMPEEPVMISGIDVQFSAKGTSNIICEIREVDGGEPTYTVLASAMLTPDEVTSIVAGEWTRFSWNPVVIQPTQDYAIVLMCDDALWAVRIATIGGIDLSVPSLVSEQPYTIGVLLSSSNGKAWTPDQMSDLTFRAVEPSYTATSSTVSICSASATSADMIMVAAVVDRPMTGTDVRFKIITSVTTYTAYENFPVLLPTAYTGVVSVTAELYGTENASPTIHRDLTILCGAGMTSGSYVTRAIPCATAGGTCRATMNMNAFVISNSSITVSAQNGVDGGGDPVWSSDFDLYRDEDIGNNWYDRAYTVSDLTVTSTRFKVVLSSTPQFPAFARNIQAYCVETT